jgi:hypothetical protein
VRLVQEASLEGFVKLSPEWEPVVRRVGADDSRSLPVVQEGLRGLRLRPHQVRRATRR